MDTKKFDLMIALSTTLTKNNRAKVSKAAIKPQIEKMAKEIFANQDRLPEKCQRTYEKIFQSCEYIAVEYALAWAVKGNRNELEFDPSKPETYYYDVSADSKLMGRKIYFEAKRWKRAGGEFFAYPTSGLKTMLKHKDKLDFVVAARVIGDEDKDNYIVEFKRIMDAPTFHFFITKSKHNDWESYYNHFKDDKYSLPINVQ